MAIALRFPWRAAAHAQVEDVEIVNPFPDIEAQQAWAERVARASVKAELHGLRYLHPCGLHVNRGELENASPRQVVEWAEGGE